MDTGSVPGAGTKIPRASGKLNLHTSTAEPLHCNKDPAQPKFFLKNTLTSSLFFLFTINVSSSRRSSTSFSESLSAASSFYFSLKPILTSDGVTPSRCFPWSLALARQTPLQLLHHPWAGQVPNALQLLLSLQKLPSQSPTH